MGGPTNCVGFICGGRGTLSRFGIPLAQRTRIDHHVARVVAYRIPHVVIAGIAIGMRN